MASQPSIFYFLSILYLCIEKFESFCVLNGSPLPLYPPAGEDVAVWKVLLNRGSELSTARQIHVMNSTSGVLLPHIESCVGDYTAPAWLAYFQALFTQSTCSSDRAAWYSLLRCTFAIRFAIWFLVWTFCEYATHRWLFHSNHKWNPFFKIHQFHHSLSLESLCAKENRYPKPLYFVWFFDNVYETLEILIGETIWALLIYWVDPEVGLPLLCFHYVYELLATDSLLEHNAELEAPLGLAVGKFHLEHHRVPTSNFGFTIDLWDRVFGTYRASTGKKYL